MTARSQVRLQERRGLDSAGNTETGLPPTRFAIGVSGSGLTRTIAITDGPQQFSGSVAIVFTTAGAAMTAISPVAVAAGTTAAALMTALAAAIETADAAAEASVVLTGTGASRTLTVSTPITAISALSFTLTDTAPTL